MIKLEEYVGTLDSLICLSSWYCVSRDTRISWMVLPYGWSVANQCSSMTPPTWYVVSSPTIIVYLNLYKFCIWKQSGGGKTRNPKSDSQSDLLTHKKYRHTCLGPRVDSSLRCSVHPVHLHAWSLMTFSQFSPVILVEWHWQGHSRI